MLQKRFWKSLPKLEAGVIPVSRAGTDGRHPPVRMSAIGTVSIRVNGSDGDFSDGKALPVNPPRYINYSEKAQEFITGVNNIPRI